MADIDTYRDRFPEESKGLSDKELADKVYNQFYTNIPREQFDRKFLAQTELKEYKPTERDQIARFLLKTPEGREEFDTPENRSMGTKIVKGLVGSEGYGVTNPSLIDFTPAGNVLSYDEFDRAVKEGDYATGAVSALGMVPLVGKPAASAVQAFVPKGIGLRMGWTEASREQAAAGKVAQAAQEDFAARTIEPGQPGINPREVSPNMLRNRAERIGQQGQPEQDLKLLDMGGDATQRAFSRAARESPEGGSFARRVVPERFEGQTARVEAWLDRKFPGAATGEEALAQARDAGQAPTSALYQTAYKDGDRDVITQRLADMLDNPEIEAMFHEGERRIALIKAGEGVEYRSRHGQIPTLALWDQVKRVMDGKISTLIKNGDREAARPWIQIRNAMVAELDREVPSYGAARGYASQFFKAGNAFEAGQEVAHGNWSPFVLEHAQSKMKPAEREAFQRGFLNDYINTVVRKVGDRQSVVSRLAQNPAERAKLNSMLGPELASEFTTVLASEELMEVANKSLGGSITAQATSDLRKQAQRLTVPTLVAAAGTAATGTVGGAAVAIATGAIMHAAQRAQTHVDEDIAKRVIQKLWSTDPNVYEQGLKEVMAYEPLRLSMTRAAAQLGAVTTKGVVASETTDEPKGRGGYVDVQTPDEARKLPVGTWVRTPEGRYGKVKARGKDPTMVPVKPNG